MYLTRLCLPFLLALAGSASAASIAFNFDSSLVYAEPGGTAAFSGAITNTGGAPAFLNGSSVNFPIGTIDDSPFFALPLNLAPLQVASGPLFSIAIPNGTAVNTYVGTFTILGGDTPSASATLFTATFAVTVVPEPSSALLALGGTALLALYRRFRRGRSTP